MAFRRGGGIRYPSPPLSGGSKLNNSTCGIEKKNRAPSRVQLNFVFTFFQLNRLAGAVTLYDLLLWDMLWHGYRCIAFSPPLLLDDPVTNCCTFDTYLLYPLNFVGPLDSDQNN